MLTYPAMPADCTCRLDPDHRESLLCEDRSDYAAATFNNLKLSCNVAGNCELQVSKGDCMCERAHVFVGEGGMGGVCLLCACSI
jgi:hypothetical protein